MGDFIVEEGDEAARRKRASKAAIATGLSARALEEAQDIFGDVEGLVKMYQQSRGRPSALDQEVEEEEEEEEEDGMELEDFEDDAALDDGGEEQDAVMEEGAAAPAAKPRRDPLEIEARKKALEERRAALEAKRKLDQETKAARREAKNKKMQYEKILKAIGPEAVASMFLGPEDEKIKETDWPERLQVAQNLLATGKPYKAEGQGLNHAAAQEGGAPAIDIEAAMEWVFEDLFGQKSSALAKELVEAGIIELDASSVPPGAQQEAGKAVWKMQDLLLPPHQTSSSHDMMQLNSFRAVRKPRTESTRQLWRYNESSQTSLREAIRQALVHIYEKGEEVPLIGLYRKELVGELLSMREEDAPALASAGK